MSWRKRRSKWTLGRDFLNLNPIGQVRRAWQEIGVDEKREARSRRRQRRLQQTRASVRITQDNVCAVRQTIRKPARVSARRPAPPWTCYQVLAQRSSRRPSESISDRHNSEQFQCASPAPHAHGFALIHSAHRNCDSFTCAAAGWTLLTIIAIGPFVVTGSIVHEWLRMRPDKAHGA